MPARAYNDAHVDEYSALHFASGFIMGRLGWSAPVALAVATVWRFGIEPALKRKVPDLFPVPANGTLKHLAADTLLFSAGYVMAVKCVPEPQP